MTESLLDSERVMRIAHGHWQAAGMAAAVRLGVFDALDAGADTPADIAAATSVAPDTAELLLDALVGMELVTQQPGGRYQNTSAATSHLVRGRRGYLGDLADTLTGAGGIWSLWRDFDTTITQPPHHRPPPPDDFDNAAYMRGVARAIVPMTERAAELTCAHLESRTLPVRRILDVGGGSGKFSEVLLRANPEATALQVDGPIINADAIHRMNELPEGARFQTLDARFPDVDLAPGTFDVAVYSGFSHQVSAEQNLANLRACGRLVRPGGTMVFHDYLSHTGQGDASLVTNLNWLLVAFGAVWPLPTVQDWLHDAGFGSGRHASTGYWTTVVTAEKRADP